MKTSMINDNDTSESSFSGVRTAFKLSLHESFRWKIQNINNAKAAKNFDEDHYKVKNILVVFAQIFSYLCIVFILNLSSEALM